MFILSLNKKICIWNDFQNIILFSSSMFPKLIVYIKNGN